MQYYMQNAAIIHSVEADLYRTKSCQLNRVCWTYDPPSYVMYMYIATMHNYLCNYMDQDQV